MIRRRTGARRWARKAEAQTELYATARQLDSAAAQVLMFAEDDFITDEIADEIEDIYQALRRVIGEIDTRREFL